MLRPERRAGFGATVEKDRVPWDKYGRPAFLLSTAGKSSQAFEVLAIPLFASLYNFAHWLTQNREEAEGIVQETYANALKGFGGFQQGTNFRAWMFRILRNTLQASCAEPKLHTFSFDEESAIEYTRETSVLAGADQQVVESALGQLPIPFREVVLLCDVDEMSYKEAADALDIPIGTVMSRLSRARHAMRQLLAAKMRPATP